MVIYSNSFNKMLHELREDCKISHALICCKASLLDSDVNYITMRGNMVSYLPAGKEHRVNDEGRWIRDGRQEGKPARVVRKLFPDDLWEDLNFKDVDLEKFTNNIRSYISANGDGEGGDTDKITMWVCNGDLIPLYYSEDSFSEYAGGNLRTSCMVSRDMEYFELYAKNHDKISMVVALDSQHMLLGRALLWNTSIGYCMDTIYAKDDVRPMFIKFAKDNDCYYKSEQSCHHDTFDMKDGEKIKSMYVEAKLRHDEFDYYPYLDTMRYLDYDGVISNREPDDNCRLLRSTDGGFEEYGCNTEDCVTGERIREDEATYIDYRFEGRWYSGYTIESTVCASGVGSVLEDHTVDIDGICYLRDSDEIVFVDRVDEYMHTDDVVFNERGDAIPRDEAVKHADTREWIHIDDAVEVEDGWVYEDEAKKIRGVWVRIDNNETENQEA
jgi:hypothetical protein